MPRRAAGLMIAALALASCNNTSFYSVLGNKAQVQKLAISPASTTVPPNGSITFSASGGEPPYTFSVLSGVGSINSSSGVYTAPATPATTIIQVADKQGSTATATVTNVDYSVTAINNTSATLLAGDAASGNFTLQNVGTAGGAQTVSWTVYISTSATLGAGGTVLTAGTTTPLASGATSTITFSGTWPSTPGTYYLIATVSSPDGLVAPNNTLASSAISITAANVDYSVTSVTCTSGAVLSGGAVSGNFQMINNGPNNGTQYVTWQAYASTSSTLSGSAQLVASGSSAPLNSGVSSAVIPFSGQWPLTYGNYYLIVKVTVPVDVDVNLANNVRATGTTTAVGFINEASYEPANNSYLTAPALGITLQPGMSLYVTGSLSLTDLDDFLAFNTGTANTITFSMSWATTGSVNLEVDDTTGTLVQGVGITSFTSVSLSWPTTGYTPNVPMLIDSKNVGATSPGAYTMIISAN